MGKQPQPLHADPQIGANETLVIGDRYVYFALPDWKGAGVAVPIFSLRSEKSFGVGDFGDLKQMIDWAVLTRQKAVQILPINDTTMTHTWTDSYPYNSISIYAFHPMYADLKQMGTLKDKKAMTEFNKRQKELNALPTVDYEAVKSDKMGVLPPDIQTGRRTSSGIRCLPEVLRKQQRMVTAIRCVQLSARCLQDTPTSANGRNSQNTKQKK